MVPIDTEWLDTESVLFAGLGGGYPGGLRVGTAESRFSSIKEQP
jgi:hypothetical protein